MVPTTGSAKPLILPDSIRTREVVSVNVVGRRSRRRCAHR